MTPTLTENGSISTSDYVETRSTSARARSTSWVLLFLYGLMLAFLSMYWLLRGRLVDHDLYERVGGISWTLMDALHADIILLLSMVVRMAGAAGLIAALFVMGVSATAYRREERWAWYMMWALPLGSTFDIAILAANGALSVTSLVWDLYMLAVSLLGLILPYEGFFPEKAKA